VRCLWAYRQWAAVSMVEGPITLPPQDPSTRHCHGHECCLASVPPTIRDTETSGWIAGLPHCPDGVGGSNVGPVGGDNLGWNDLQMYFRVIKSGTNRKLVYAFLLVVYSHFCRITHRLWEIWCETVKWPWNMAKVIGADSMGRWGRSLPRPKSCGGDALKSVSHEFCCHFLKQ